MGAFAPLPPNPPNYPLMGGTELALLAKSPYVTEFYVFEYILN